MTRELPPDAPMTILVGTYPASSVTFERDIRALTERLEASGYRVYYANVDLGSKGRWQRVLAGAYTDLEAAEREADRINVVVPGVGSAGRRRATAAIGSLTREPDPGYSSTSFARSVRKMGRRRRRVPTPC